MRLKFQFIILLCSLNFDLLAQSFASLNIGDAAPPLKVKDWIKGTPIQNFEKDKIYVVEFWATWCLPCRASMPRLSETARKYQDKITVLSIDVYEKENTPLAKVKKFVDNMGNRMDFSVGVEENRLMAKNWVDASGFSGIPSTFVVNNGKLDWIGHPKYLDSVLTRILNKTWSREFALLKRNHELYLNHLGSMGSQELLAKIDRHVANTAANTYDRVKITPDSIIFVIDDMVKNVPSLEFLPTFISFKFAALLQTEPQKAYVFAREVINKPIYGDDPPYYTLIATIEDYSEKLLIPRNIYRLGAECYQGLIDSNPYPEFGDTPSKYKKMANLYKLAGDLPKAKESERKGEEYLFHLSSYKRPVN